jgi:Spy/CpxP family protein refolding chaperone
MKKISVLVLLVVLVASTTVVMARPPYKGIGMEAGRGGKASVFQNLNLTEEQSEKIGGLREALQKEITPLRTEIVRKQTEMKLLWMEDNLDQDKIKAQHNEILTLRGKIADKFLDFRLAFHKSLTLEQRSQLLAKGPGKKGSFRHGIGDPRGLGMGPSSRW